MHKTPLFWQIFSLLVFVALFHIASTYLYWYWNMFWSHMVSHFLSGLLVALTALWFYFLSGYIKHEPKKGSVFWIAFLSSLIVGVLWECFELGSGLTLLSSPTYFLDNGADVLMDVAGGLIAYVYFSYKGYSRV